jgi:hypothetical protein
MGKPLLAAVLLVTACVNDGAQSPSASVCPPVTVWSTSDQIALSAELDRLPAGAMPKPLTYRSVRIG